MRIACFLGGALLCLAMPAAAEPFGKKPDFRPPAGEDIPANYRSTWQRVSNLAVSGLHWQQWIVVYASPKYADTYRHNRKLWCDQFSADELAGTTANDKYGPYAPGTVLVKESFSGPDAKHLSPVFLAMMLKREPGFDTKHGDWEYMRVAPDGEVLMRGSLKDPVTRETCGSCHLNVAERDYVFATTGATTGSGNSPSAATSTCARVK